MNDDPCAYQDVAKRNAACRLAELGASLGAQDSESVHAMLTPAWGQTAIGDAVVPEIVSCVNTMGNVAYLDLGETHITDEGVRHLAKLHRMATLDLHGTAITDRSLHVLTSIQGLRKLSLSGTEVTDAGVPVLMTMTQLQHLQLFETRISKHAVMKLTSALPGTAIEHDFRFRCG